MPMLLCLLLAQAPPILVTDRTLADAAKVRALQTAGKVIFSDGFEAKNALESYFEVRGQKEGWAKIVEAPRSGRHALSCTAPNRSGASSGSGVSYWFGGTGGYEKVHLRYYVKFKDDYDQGNLNHTGAALTAAAGDNKWRGMGTAGIKPNG